LGKLVDEPVMAQLAKVKEGLKAVEHVQDKYYYRVITHFKVPYTETQWYIVNLIPDTNDFYSHCEFYASKLAS